MEMLALVVDDEEQCVQTLLNGIDWKSVGIDRALGALSADEARDIIRKNPVALILCDIEMPGESGLEFIQWIRDDADLNGANMECIILTCYPDYNFMRKAMQMGCSDYLIKPIDETELYDVLKKAVTKLCERRDKSNQEVIYDDTDKESIIDEKVIPYIQLHYTENLTVSEIAEDAALNAQYMMRLFKKKTGHSVFEYVTGLRLKQAKELLKKTQWTNEIVSEKVGYASSNYFIKLFKKEFGMTPREYRKKSF